MLLLFWGTGPSPVPRATLSPPRSPVLCWGRSSSRGNGCWVHGAGPGGLAPQGHRQLPAGTGAGSQHQGGCTVLHTPPEHGVNASGGPPGPGCPRAAKAKMLPVSGVGDALPQSPAPPHRWMGGGGQDGPGRAARHGALQAAPPCPGEAAASPMAGPRESWQEPNASTNGSTLSCGHPGRTGFFSLLLPRQGAEGRSHTSARDWERAST